MTVLVIDVGGSHVKLCLGGGSTPRQFDSAEDLTPQQMVDRVLSGTRDWDYDVVSLGIPAVVGPVGLVREPGNLGSGWVGFDFGKAFARPVRVVNDAAMQALGAYDGGRMLFLGMGTGVGSALVIDHVVIPMELGDLPWDGMILSKHLGREGFKRLDEAAWRLAVIDAAQSLLNAMSADYAVLGGGKARLLEPLPARLRSGGNHDAFIGGFRMWEQPLEPQGESKRPAWRISHQSLGVTQ